jgi:hypothetical protein
MDYEGFFKGHVDGLRKDRPPDLRGSVLARGDREIIR